MSDGARGPTGASRDRLIVKQQDRARTGRLLTGRQSMRDVDRLPPGQRPARGWPVLDLGVQPDIPRARFRLIVDGAVGNPVVLDGQGLTAPPQSESVSGIHCVTAWSRDDNRWSGVRAADLLAQVRPRAEARHVLFQSSDGYTTNVPLAALADDHVMLAHGRDGAPLDRRHGGPLRVVIPELHLWRRAKGIGRITVATEDRPGFRETRGYHNHGDPWMEERYG